MMSVETKKMTQEQNELVMQHLHVVDWSIWKNINVNEHIQGLGSDDLHQVGYLALCHAAQTYDGRVQFETFAQLVVKNKLLDHCSSAARKQRNQFPLNARTDSNDDRTYQDLFSVHDTDTLAISEAKHALHSAKARYKGTTLKGIEVLELKIKGYSGKEIAKMYGVPANHVGAWLSKAVKALRLDEAFCESVL